MPLYRRLPKRGLNQIKRYQIAKINLEKIQLLINKNRINKSETLNIDLLKKNNILNKSFKMLKILGTGEIQDKINIETHFLSKNAKQKLDKVGCSVPVKTKF